MADLIVTVPSGTLTLPADVIVPAARIPDLPAGAVSSVNGETGVVVLDAADVGAATAAQGGLADSAVQPGDLGGAAGLDVGTTAGTVAAGDDSRITGAVQGSDLDTDVTALDANAASALRVQQDARLSSTFVTVVNAGSNLSTARPAGAAVVYWTFSAGVDVGSAGVNIVNRAAGDLYWVASA